MKRLALFALLPLVAVVVALFWQARPPVVDGPGGFDLFAFFEGEATSEGTVQTLLVRNEAFTARFAGRAEGETFVLEERFRFADREPLQIWRLKRAPDGYAGTVETQRADGTLGSPVAVRGTASDTGIVLDYEGFAPGGGTTAFGFRHVLKLRGDGRVVNHVTVQRFGLPIAVSNVIFTQGPGALPSPTGER